MRVDKFNPIRERFIDYFKQECRNINAEFSRAGGNVKAHFGIERLRNCYKFSMK
jgi:hypothetical protein